MTGPFRIVKHRQTGARTTECGAELTLPDVRAEGDQIKKGTEAETPAEMPRPRVEARNRVFHMPGRPGGNSAQVLQQKPGGLGMQTVTSGTLVFLVSGPFTEHDRAEAAGAGRGVKGGADMGTVPLQAEVANSVRGRLQATSSGCTQNISGCGHQASR